MGWVNAPKFQDDLNILTRWPLAVAKAISQIGNTRYGNASISPNANGNGTIAHLLPSTPSFANVNISGDNSYHAKVQSVDATNITVLIKDSSGADVASGTYTIYWIAKV